MARKKRSSVGELTKVCSEVLKVSKQHSYLWDEPVWGESEFSKGRFLKLFSGSFDQDESYSIYIEKKGNRFVFDGKNFCYGDNGFSSKKAAYRMRNFGISPDCLRERFYLALQKPLGKYLARKELGDLING